MVVQEQRQTLRAVVYNSQKYFAFLWSQGVFLPAKKEDRYFAQ